MARGAYPQQKLVQLKGHQLTKERADVAQPSHNICKDRSGRTETIQTLFFN